MRGLVLAAVTAAGIGLLGLAGASAMPANGIAVGQAVAVDQMIEQVWGGGATIGGGTAGIAGGAGDRDPAAPGLTPTTS
jgi:hypothetical protein